MNSTENIDEYKYNTVKKTRCKSSTLDWNKYVYLNNQFQIYVAKDGRSL